MIRRALLGGRTWLWDDEWGEREGGGREALRRAEGDESESWVQVNNSQKLE